MRSALTIVAAAVILTAAASAAEPAKPAPLPKPGDAVRIDVEVQKPTLSQALNYDALRIGDPDSEKFEDTCRPSLPLSVEVIGVIDETIVGRYRSPAKPGDFMACANGSVILTDRAGWAGLKALEAAAAREKAAKEKRREQIRRLLRSPAPPSAPAK